MLLLNIGILIHQKMKTDNMKDFKNELPEEYITTELATTLIDALNKQREKSETVFLPRQEYNNVREMIAINSKILSKIDWVRENMNIYGKDITLKDLEETLWDQWKNIDNRIEETLNVK